MEWLLAKLLERLKDLYSEDKINFGSNPIISPVVQMLQGHPVSADELLKVDDFAVWVLVSQVAGITKGDATAENLANRLIERDPLRSVPVDSHRLENFLQKGTAAHQKIEKVVSKFVPGEAKYFYQVDHPRFDVFEKEDGMKAMLVDTADANRPVSFLANHAMIRKTFEDTVDLGVRLLVPREAREEVTKLISGVSAH